MDKKFKHLFQNAGLLLIGNFSSKILVFLLVPFYTSILTTEEYGSYDLLYTTIQMLLPILSLNILDAVMRYTIGESKENQKESFTIGLKYVALSCVLLVVGTLFCAKVMRYDIIEQYYLEFIFLFISYTLNQFIIQFARGIDDISGISIAGVIGTIIMIAGNLLFLLVFKSGLNGYFYAYILSFAVPAFFLFFRDRMYEYKTNTISIFRLTEREKGMLKYTLPLMFTTLSWYINGVSDRYAVTYFCGIGVNGVYSVSYKIPAILNAIQTIFIQAWQLSAIKEYGDKSSERFYISTYEGCQTVMVLLCSSLILGTRILAKILFADDFYVAWLYVPTLLLYVVFNTLSGTIGGIFSATKDTNAVAKSAIVGAATNIILNIVMVFYWGAEGAAIATVISSIVIWYMRMHYSEKYVNFGCNIKKHIMEYILLIFQAVSMTLMEGLWCYLIQIGIILLLLLMNYKKILSVVKTRNSVSRN